jgi:hypothetical protein
MAPKDKGFFDLKINVYKNLSALDRQKLQGRCPFRPRAYGSS